MYNPEIALVLDPCQRAVREKSIPSMHRQQVQKRELELIRAQQAQASRGSRQAGLGSRIAALWVLVANRSAGTGTS